MRCSQNPCLSRPQQLLLLLLLIAQFPVAVQSTFSLWTFFVIFPQIRCFLRLWLMNYDPTAYERFDVFYREDSVERLAETVRKCSIWCVYGLWASLHNNLYTPSDCLLPLWTRFRANFSVRIPFWNTCWVGAMPVPFIRPHPR